MIKQIKKYLFFKSNYSKLTFCKIVWIFFLLSIIGFYAESIFCILTTGHLESRKGLIYGPISQIYGFGAVILSIFLHKFVKTKSIIIFFYSGIIGGIFEFICSLFQENIFGTISWEYSNLAFSIYGRTSLIFVVFWGLLGVVFVKDIYPILSNIVDLFPKYIQTASSLLIVFFLIFDIFISATAVKRWTNRNLGIPPKNNFEIFLNEKYNNDFLHKIYPNMKIVN